MRGRPAVYATFSSYDEVAHHSGLERADTLEALRKLDQHFARINRARRFAPRPYKLVVLSDHGQTQGADVQAAQRLRPERARRALDRERDDRARRRRRRERRRRRPRGHGGHRQSARTTPRTGRSAASDVVALASGNLGLIYLMEERRRLTLEEIEERHPRLLPALREHPHIGFLLVRSREHGAVVLGARGARYLRRGPRRGRRSARAVLRQTQPRICAGPTGSSTSPTSWSTASTTPSSSRGARSRS